MIEEFVIEILRLGIRYFNFKKVDIDKVIYEEVF